MIQSIFLDQDNDTHIVLQGAELSAAWADLKVLVTGIGHSGTNLMLEMVKASGYFNYIRAQEDRFFSTGITLLLTENYLAKLACDSHTFDLIAYKTNMEKFPGLTTLCVVRHPMDAILSGVYRGLPISEGGDAPDGTEIPVFDATEAKKKAQNHTDYYSFLVSVVNRFGRDRRSLLFRMEDVLTRTEEVAKDLAGWLGIDYKPEMAKPWKFNSHKGQMERYQGNLDTNQIDVYKRWETEYNGFFADKEEFIMVLAEELKPIAKTFDYRIEL